MTTRPTGRVPRAGVERAAWVRTGRPARVPGGYAERLFVALISAAVGLGLAAVLFNFSVRPWPEPQLSTVPPEFDGATALARTREFVTSFPSRAAGDPGKTQAAQWIVDQLVTLGYDPQVQTFGAWVGGVYHPDLANVWAVRRGTSTETVAVYGHYDIPPFVREGAADDGSAVGAMLELASCFAEETPGRTILFVFLDCSEYGMAGADAFLAWKPYPDPIVAGVGLDFLNVGEMAGISLEFTGTQKGYTPPWLRSLGRDAAAAYGQVFTVGPFAEWAERAVAVSPTDTGVFLRRHIPALNLAGVPVDTALERSVYHTSGDGVGNLRADALEKWGRTAELIIRSVCERPSVTRGQTNSMVYLGLDGDRYVPGWAVRTIQFLLFSPLWGVVGVGWHWRRRSLVPTLQILPAEARRLLTVAGCLALGLFIMKLSVVFGLLPRYHVYPATPKDPFLYQPAVLPVALALAVVAVVLWVAARRTRWLTPPLGADWPERYHALTTGLAVLVFLVWLEGAGFAAVAFLGLPAYLWLFLAEPTGRAAWAWRGLGGILVAGGTAAFAAFLALFGEVFITGPVWWYVVAGATYGLFSLKASLVFFVTTALHWEAFACGTGVGAGRLLPSAVATGLETGL